ncbi:MAG: cob(I)yrinic acid a,c-diamide adenosyltransferase [Oscillospiraceae bacterium]
MEKGLVQIYCGNGKGKTTAAAGQSIRAAGRGFKVLFTQFFKDYTSGEISVLESIENIEVFKGTLVTKFVFAMTEEEKKQLAAEVKEQFADVCRKAAEEGFDMLVMDEVLDVIGMGFLTEDEAAEFLAERPKGLEVVMTGRNPGERLTAAADYISEIEPVKHPYDKGVKSRIGIEY